MWVCCYRVLHFCMQICIISQISKQSKKYWKNLIIFSLCKVCYFTVLGPTLIIESLQSMLANTFELMLIENGFQELLELAISPEDAEPTFSKHTLLSFSSLSRQFYVLPAIATLQMTFCIIYLSYRYLYVRYTSANDTSILLLKLITVWNKSSNFISNRMLIIKRKRYCLTFFDLITYRIEVRVKSIFLRKRNGL